MLAARPPMGWNSWNTFGENINEKLIMEMADVIVEKGYKDLGYEYVVIDDCWAKKDRNAEGKLEADPEKFPHGMKYLSDYIHSKGLKFGMYSCAGVLTCAGYPSSYGHEFVDAKTFADWGVDFLKYDFCHFPKSGNCKHAYATMSMALKASGREILFSACNWGREEPWRWMRSIGVHMYRSTGDIFDSFVSFADIVNSQKENFCMSAPGCYNDIDMLIAGMHGKGHVGIESGCTDKEYKMHFALWCMFGAPLMIGGDIRDMDPYCEALMKNKTLLRINQDEEARPPYPADCNSWDTKDTVIYIKHLSGNEFAIAMLNLSDELRRTTFYFDEAGLPYSSGLTFELKDAFTGEQVQPSTDFIKLELESHDMVLYMAKVVER